MRRVTAHPRFSGQTCYNSRVRYIGSKDRLLPFIQATLDAQGIRDGLLLDPFCGTTAVARHARAQGFSVVSGDVLEFSYVLQRAYLCSDGYPRFAGLALPGGTGPAPSAPLATVLCYLNALPPLAGFIQQQYSPAGGAAPGRMYFSVANAGRIDAVRGQIAAWQAAGRLVGEEAYVLLAALLAAVPGVSNIAGTYGAYLKTWDSRALAPLTLRLPLLTRSPLAHRAYHGDAAALVAAQPCAVLYLDPPYNGRPYASNYHLLETIACGDTPAIYGKTGLRPYARSPYNSAATAAATLAALVAGARCRHLLLSYNSEGVIPEATILAILAQRGVPVVARRPYRRFRSRVAAARHPPPGVVSENLYYVRCAA